MKVTACKTDLMEVGNSLYDFLDHSFYQKRSSHPAIKEGSIVAIAGKVVSISEGSVYPSCDAQAEKEMILRESDAFLCKEPSDSNNSSTTISLTIKNGMVMKRAGLTTSNIRNGYVAFPRSPFESARKIWKYLQSKHKINRLGVIITDSVYTPLRRGVTGIAIGWCGISPLYNYTGKKDCMGRSLRYTAADQIDALASTAAFVMGEGNEQTSLVIIQEIPQVTFSSRPPTAEEISSVFISESEDMYAPCMNYPKWRSGKTSSLSVYSLITPMYLSNKI